MKIKNLFAIAALLMGSMSVSAQTASGIFKITVADGKATIKGFTADTPASQQVDVTVPETLTNEDGDDFSVVTIGADAFKGNANLKSISIAKTVTTIESGAFNDCSQLATVTFATGSLLAKIGDNAFGDTPSLESISLANCSKLTAFATDGYKTPFVNASNVNYQLKELTLNTATTNIGTALAGLKGLTTVNLSETAITGLAANSLKNTDALTTLSLPATCKSILATGKTNLTSLTIAAKDVNLAIGSFTMSNTANSTITFGEIDGATIAANSIVGPTAKDITTTLTLGAIKSALSNVIVSGNVLSATVGDIAAGVAVSSDVFSGAVTININAIADGGSIAAGTVANATTTTINFIAGKTITGAAAIAAGAFTQFSKLATVNVKATIATAAAFEAGSFGDPTNKAGSGNDPDDDGIRMTVNYAPAKYIAAFAATAFLNATGTKEVKFVTNRTFITGATFATDYGTDGANFFRVKIEAPAEEVTITVAKKDGRYLYGQYYNTASMLKIAKTQNNKTVAVYGAYVDMSDNTIYMDQLHVIGGYYFVPANVPVVVKYADESATEGEVKAIALDAILDAGIANTGSMNLASATKYMSQICVNDKTHNTGAKVQNNTTDKDWSLVTLGGSIDNNNFAIFFMYPAASYNFYWDAIKAGAKAPEGAFYLRVNKELIAAGARVKIVWNDGSEADQTTGIQAVQTVAETEDGVMYNLSGQKVSGAYKGVVIKNGKKYMK